MLDIPMRNEFEDDEKDEDDRFDYDNDDECEHDCIYLQTKD